MDDTHPNTTGEADRVRGLLVSLRERTSRQGFLAQVWRMALWVLGISLAPILPVDRLVKDAEACTSCSNCLLCNICGTLCGCYGGGLYDCPPCAGGGNSWGGCCACGTSRYIVNYIDCCTSQPSLCVPSGTCSHCCPKVQFNWCGNSNLTYICTIIQTQGFC